MSGGVAGAPLSRRERIYRMRSRAWVVHILYRWESRGADRRLDEAAQAVRANRRISPSRLPLIREHVERLDAHLEEIDRTIQACMDNWRLERLSRIDRAILRLATSEILYEPELSPAIAIQEGIRLAGQYGGTDSPRFVNGILDAVLRIRTA